MIESEPISISVLMPVYKPNPQWLQASIESLNCQTFKHWKLILSLDGNDPATLASVDIAFRSIRNKERLFVVRGPRSGITSALNRGLEACDTKYTARLDADDICTLRRLEEQRELLEMNNRIVACGMQIQRMDADGKYLGKKANNYPVGPTSTLVVGALFNNPIAHPVLMFRTQLVKDIGGYRPKVCMEDYDLIARLCILGEVTNLESIGLEYREHKGQHSRKIRPNKKDLLAARILMLKRLATRNPLSVVLIIAPIALYLIGPFGEHKMRMLLHKIRRCANVA